MKSHNSILPILHRQAGGTFLGLILGLIVGLGIAVLVALMITKSPMPFVNKVIKQERTELSSGQAADPNKPLYGKDSAKDFASEQRSAPELKPAETLPLPAPAELNTANKALAVAQDPSVKSDNASDNKWNYFLQTGAFREQAEAENARAKLALLGVEAKVSERVADNGILYRVRIGPITQVEAVNRMRGKLSDNGIDAAIVRVPP